MLTRNDEQVEKDLGKGVTRKVLSWDEGMMVCELTFRKGSVGELHSHPHEQIGYVISGSFSVSCGDETKVLRAGDSYLIPPSVVHGVVALEDSRLLDVFSPMRKDFVD